MITAEQFIDRLRQVEPGSDWVMVNRAALEALIAFAREASKGSGRSE